MVVIRGIQAIQWTGPRQCHGMPAQRRQFRGRRVQEHLGGAGAGQPRERQDQRGVRAPGELAPDPALRSEGDRVSVPVMPTCPSATCSPPVCSARCASRPCRPSAPFTRSRRPHGHRSAQSSKTRPRSSWRAAGSRWPVGNARRRGRRSTSSSRPARPRSPRSRVECKASLTVNLRHMRGLIAYLRAHGQRRGYIASLAPYAETSVDGAQIVNLPPISWSASRVQCRELLATRASRTVTGCPARTRRNSALSVAFSLAMVTVHTCATIWTSHGHFNQITPLRADGWRVGLRPCRAPQSRARSGPEGSSSSGHRC